MSLLVKRGLYWVAVFVVLLFGILIFVHNTKFFFGGQTGFLLTKTKAVFDDILFRTAFYVHIATGSLVLIIGIFQFRSHINKVSFHRTLGKIYVATILFLTGPTGMIMGFFANGGLIPTVSFITLSGLWWLFTYLAWKKIIIGDVLAHQVYMYRSYSLTLSAVTLRLYTFLAALFFELRGEEVYIWVSVLSWIPNLIIAEMLISYRAKTSSKPQH